MPFARTPAFADFVAPAATRPALWRLALGTVTALAVYLGWVGGMLGLSAWLFGLDDTLAIFADLATPDAPVTTMLLLATFIGMAAAPIIAAAIWQRRGPGTLLGPVRRVLRDFARAALTVAALFALGLAGWALFFDSLPGLPPTLWALTLLPALLGVLIQTGAEELVFRGYLMQQLAARFRSPLVWFLLPALLFGAIHYDPASQGASAPFVVASATLFGLVAADLTRLTGSIGAAWGFHFVNNVVALQLVATQGTITGLALRLTPYHAADLAGLPWAAAADLALVAAAWALLRRVLRP